MSTARAPGKMVLAGEYAVLEGHRAVVAAVDRFAHVSAQPGELSVAALGATCAGRRGTTGIVLDDVPAFALVQALFAEAHTRGLEIESAHYITDSSTMGLDVGRGEKLGVGSSAAVCAAFARLILGTDASADDVFALADGAHLRFSRGRGSGIDVAASVYGGVLRYQNRRAAPFAHNFGALVPLAVFVGHSQSTRAFLDQTAALKARDVAAYTSCIDAIAGAADAFCAGAEAGNETAIIAATADARDAMRKLGEACGADIVSAPHKRVSDIAHAHGGAAKPSGAGGGDLAIAFVPQDAAAKARAAFAAAGLVVVDVAVGAPGARVDPV